MKLNLVFMGLLLTAVQAFALNLEEYKSQVMAHDPQTQAILEQKRGAELVVNQADFLTGVNVFATGGYLDDQRPTTNPGFQGNRTTVNSMSFGLQQQTRLGLKWSLSQNIQETKIENASPTAIPVPEYYDTFPKLELALPLWRNLLGRETSAEQDRQKLQAEAQKKQAEIAWIQRQSEIEEIFYNLMSQQEAYEIQKDSLARAERILEWSKSRVKRNLADEGDVYQSQAAVSARLLDLNHVETQLRVVAREFNALRGIPDEEVKEKLVGQNLNLNQLKLDRSLQKVRKDLKVQRDLNLSNMASYKAQRERNKPSLDLTLQAQTQGRGETYSRAQRNTFEDEDYLYLGLTLTMPLDQKKASRVRSGYDKLAESQVLLEQARMRDVALTWAETADQAEQLLRQLEILRDLEVIQRKNADSERGRLNRGRSTTFQVLSFEQEYNAVRAQRIQAEFKARQFLNQLSLFE